MLIDEADFYLISYGRVNDPARILRYNRMRQANGPTDIEVTAEPLKSP